MSLKVIGRLESVSANGEGNIYLELSKEDKTKVLPLVAMLRDYEGKDIVLTVKELTRKEVR